MHVYVSQAFGLSESASTSNLMRQSFSGLVLMIMEVLIFGPQNQQVRSFPSTAE